ncbi:DUF418 domain-containing protein [Tsukamurella strandjordii]|uniref:DUF418 domain-containing protein n=1 Tax=Tsukamurella TaxID=2060 RepID=UPI001C7D662C|nr:DUF418 domain-containing protein [Tsukamurella sp. TY48]GIZ99050.1 hypothetical protein TTY48_36620 [Tsukamurella sp. TY48]
MAFLSWIPNGKFLGLLTIMFGIGVVIQQRSAQRHGRQWPGTYPVRCALLFLDGLVNYIFMVQFDVLRAYAVVAFIVAFLVLFSDRIQLWLAALFLAVHIGYLVYLTLQDNGGMPPPPPGPQLPEGSTDIGWWDLTLYNLQNLPQAFMINAEFPTLAVMAVALFLLGGAVYRHGVFEAGRRRLRYWLMAVGFGVALPADFTVSVLFPEYSSWGRYLFAAGVSFGLLALVTEYGVRRGGFGRTGTMMSLVGRMALTCYLLQNILGVLGQYLVFNRDFFARLNYPAAAVGAWLAISAILIVFSWWLWLRKFDRGPAEILWHRAYDLTISGVRRVRSR